MTTRDPLTFLPRSDTTQMQPKQADRPLALPARTLTSDSIFRGERDIGIEHHGALYRLKVTRQGKLILNK